MADTEVIQLLDIREAESLYRDMPQIPGVPPAELAKFFTQIKQREPWIQDAAQRGMRQGKGFVILIDTKDPLLGEIHRHVSESRK